MADKSQLRIQLRQLEKLIQRIDKDLRIVSRELEVMYSEIRSGKLSEDERKDLNEQYTFLLVRRVELESQEIRLDREADIIRELLND